MRVVVVVVWRAEEEVVEQLLRRPD